jgi:hypothetical protein
VGSQDPFLQGVHPIFHSLMRPLPNYASELWAFLAPRLYSLEKRLVSNDTEHIDFRGSEKSCSGSRLTNEVDTDSLTHNERF